MRLNGTVKPDVADRELQRGSVAQLVCACRLLRDDTEAAQDAAARAAAAEEERRRVRARLTRAVRCQTRQHQGLVARPCQENSTIIAVQGRL